jgi:uncharacterized protein (UPF0147 family)
VLFDGNLALFSQIYRRETNDKTKDRSRNFRRATKDFHDALDKSCSVKPATKLTKVEEVDQDLASTKQTWISTALSFVQVEHTLEVKRRCDISELVRTFFPYFKHQFFSKCA